MSGHIADHWVRTLGALALRHHTDGTATFRVLVADQAQLHGVLAMLRDIGAPLLSLQVLPATPPGPSGETSPGGIRRHP